MEGGKKDSEEGQLWIGGQRDLGPEAGYLWRDTGIWVPKKDSYGDKEVFIFRNGTTERIEGLGSRRETIVEGKGLERFRSRGRAVVEGCRDAG